MLMRWIASAWDRMGWASAIFVQPRENPSTVTRNNLKEGMLMHKKVKITVLRTEYYQELAEPYAIPNLGMCPFHQKGQVLYSDGINPPDGMCGVAWQVIAPMARQLSLGELVQPSGTWLNDDTIGVFACPDGIRPVIFLLEAE
ncbi:TIGR04076 family protein [Clostridium sp. AF32-12BH]|nr:TIGR04076 family protein [Clostridium sp. AF32-12BH]